MSLSITLSSGHWIRLFDSITAGTVLGIVLYIFRLAPPSICRAEGIDLVTSALLFVFSLTHNQPNGISQPVGVHSLNKVYEIKLRWLFDLMIRLTDGWYFLPCLVRRLQICCQCKCQQFENLISVTEFDSSGGSYGDWFINAQLKYWDRYDWLFSLWIWFPQGGR